MREPRQLAHEPATSMYMFHVQPKIGMARFYIEETYGTRTSDIFHERSHQHGTSKFVRRSKKRDPDMGQR
jgi:hypothetical protein